MQQAISKSTIYIENLKWADLRFCRNWLQQHDCTEAAKLSVFIDELWDGVQNLNWDNIIAQQTWLKTIDHPASKFLVKFLDDVQDLILDTDEVIEYKIANEGRPVKQARPSNLKLVVSNYFTPRERLDRPFPPAPELTILK